MWKAISKIWKSWEFADSLTALISALGWKGAIMSIGGSAAFAYWAWSKSLGHLPTALIALFVFTVLVWLRIGFIFLRTKDRPSKAAIKFDYGYGLALEEVTPAHDEGNEANCLEFRFRFRNAAPGPLKYKAERIDAIVDSRIQTLRNVSGFLPRNDHKLLFVGGFDKQTVDSLNERTEGTYEFSILYGHPDDEYSRRSKKRIHFTLVKREGKVSGAPWKILEESDEAL